LPIDYLFKRVCVTRGKILYEYFVFVIKSEILHLHICVSVQCQRQSDGSRVRIAKGVLRDCSPCVLPIFPQKSGVYLRAGEKWKESLSKINPRSSSGKSDEPPVCGKNPINPLYCGPNVVAPSF